MSMYKTIFVTDQGESAGENRFQVDGSVAITTAYASLEAAVGAISSTEANANAIVVKVVSGKYDSFTVVKNGEVTVNQATNFVAVNFGGTTTTVDGEEITVAAAPNTLDQEAVLADLNRNVADTSTYYVSAESAQDGAKTLYVGLVDDQYTVVSNTEVAMPENTVANILSIVENVSNNVAKIGDTYYATLSDAVAAEGENKVIQLIDGKAIDANVTVKNANDLTITGAADFDWSKGFFFIGRGGDKTDALVTTVTFDNAQITSASDQATYGFHVSGEEKDSNKKNGVLNIQNGSDLEVDYMINKGTVNVDDSKITIKNGFAVGGRPAKETPNGEDATAYFNATNSEVVVNNHNGMGVGYEAIGILSLNNSDFTATQSFMNTAKGTIDAVGGSSITVEGTLTNKGIVKVDDSTLAFESLDGAGTSQLFVTGESTISGTEMTGGTRLRVGQVDADGDGKYDKDADGNAVMTANNKVTFDVANAELAFANIYNAEFKVIQDTTITMNGAGGSYPRMDIRNSSFDLNGKTLTVKGGALFYGIEVQNGNLIFEDMSRNPGNTPNFGDSNENIIGVNASLTVKDSTRFGFYADAQINGTFKAENIGTILVGVNHVGKDPSIDPTIITDATITVDGQNAKFITDGAINITKFDTDLNPEGDRYGVLESSLIVKNGGAFEAATVANDGTIDIQNGSFSAGTVTNNGTFTVAGESTLNINNMSGEIDLLDGAIIKNSTVGGAAYVAGDVTFRGDNTFSMITDYGDYYSSTSPSMWTVEAGASLTLTKADRYGLGYGDKVSVYGELQNVRDMDAATRAEQFVSLNMHGGLVQMTNSAAPNAENSLTIENARVRFGSEGDKSFGNKPGNYYSNYTISVKNTIFEANGFKYYEDKGTTNLTFEDSVVTVNGIFMTNDSSSTFVFDNTSVYSKATSNGSDDKNQNAGNMIIRNNSDITYSTLFTNVGTITVTDSALSADSIVNNGTISLTITGNVLDSIIDNFWILNQDSETAAALNIGVTINNVVHNVGSEFEYNGSKFAVTSGIDGNDIVIERVVETAFVNEAWKDAEYGDEVAKGKFYLVNAFSSVGDALNNSKASEIVLESNVSGDYFTSLNNVKLSTTVEGGVTIDNTYDNWLNITGNANIGANVAINTPYAFMYGNGNKIDGKLNVAGQCYHRYDNVIEIGANGYVGCNGEAFIIRYNNENGSVGGFKITGNDVLGAEASVRDVQLYANYYCFYSGTIDAKDTMISGGQINMTNTTDGSGKAVIKLDNTVWESAGHLQMTGNASITLSNKSTLQINNIHGNSSSSTLDATSSITADDSALSFKALDNAGTITLSNGSELKVSGAVTNAGYFKIGENSTATVGSIEMAGNGMLDVWGQEGKVATLNAGSITAKGADSGFYSSYGDTTVDGTIELQGSFSIGESSLKADTFKNVSQGYQQVLRNVDLDVNNFVNDAKNPDGATISGTSKVQIDNLSGKYALTLDDDTTLKGGTSIKGTQKVSAKGDVTIGETATDVIYMENFDNLEAYSNGTGGTHSITVNGTWNISEEGKNYPDAWLNINGVSRKINGVSEQTILDGEGTINVNTSAIFQYGKIVVDKDLTINVTDQKAADLRLTLTDITIKGALNSSGSNNKQNTIQTSDVTISGKNASLTVDSDLQVGYQTYKDINDTTDEYKSTVVVEDGAKLAVGGALYVNKNSSITVDASSSFSTGSILNYGGMINSVNAGEIVLNSNMTVKNSITTDSLVLTSGAHFKGTITVQNLTLAIGSSASLNADSRVAADYITVTGELIPASAEFILVTSGFDAVLNGKDIRFDANGDGTISESEIFTVKNDIAGLSGINFVTFDGNLYVKDFGAATTGIYIGSDVEGLADGAKITDDNGVTYTVGVDAFASASDAVETLGADAAANINTIKVDKGEEVVDATQAKFSGDLTINNDGHLDANIVAGGDMTITNTSVNTLLGSYVAEGDGATVTIDNAGGMIGNAADDVDTILGAKGGVFVTGGDAADVTVNSGLLELTDTNSFGLDANSDVLTDGSIFLTGSANMSIDGALTSSNVFVSADNHTGTLTLNGQQTFTGDMSANKIVVADGKEVTFQNNTVDFNDLTIDGILNADFTKMNSYTDAGSINGEGTLNTTHTGAWIINDSVNRDLSGFAGTVTMTQAGASMVMGKGDAVDSLTAADSYFADDATVTVKDGQSVVLAGDGVATGIVFKGTGTLNVGNYDGGFVDGSNDFNQTLNGNNADFTGTVNVSEGAQLKIENALGATAINMDYNSNVNATGTADDTQLNLSKDGLTLNAKITGDANDVINVMQNATLNAAEALNGFSGTVAVADNTLTLNGANNTAAKFTGTKVIDANADQTLTATGALDGFSGKVDLDVNNLTLEGVNTTAAKFTGKYGANNVIDMTKAGADQTLTAFNALNAFHGTVAVGGNTLTLEDTNRANGKFTGNSDAVIDVNGDLFMLFAQKALNDFNGTIALEDNRLAFSESNTTAAKITGNTQSVIEAASPRIALTLTSDGALNDFSGTVELKADTLNLNGVNDTAAIFTGTNAVINANANQTFSADGALDGFKGTVAAGANTLTLTGDNTTAAKITGTGTISAGVDANGDGTAQVFTGNVSGFSGTYDIATGSSVTLSGTIADVINAKGDTLNLNNATGIDVTVNGLTGLADLNFGNNSLTLGTGLFDSVNGSGSVVFADAHIDNNFDKLVAGTVYLTDGRNIEATEFDGNIDITISAADDIADVITSSKFSDIITVTITNDSLITGNDYELIKAAGGYGVDYIKLYDGTQFVKLKLNDGAKANGFTYTLRETADKTWILNQLAGASNFVVVNAAWSGKIPFQQVWDVAADGTPVDRSFGFDAASDLKGAVDYIRGWNIGQGWDNGNLQIGDAKIELTAGKYSLSTGTLMTADNQVTQLTLAAREGEAVRISGTVLGSDGSKATTLTIDDVQISGNLAAGGKLVIDNADAARSTGTYIAGGVTAGTVGATSVAIKGGDFANRFIIGGSYVASGKAVTMTGDTSVTVTNATISGNIYGGSYIAGTAVRTAGNTSVTVDASQNVVIRGNIYAGDYTTSAGSLTGQAGTATVTFTGAADKLTFTGTVNGSDTAAESSLVFSDFAGTFNGSIKGFDKIVISGDTQLALGRRQANAAETDVWFTVTADTTAGEAMYTVRDPNKWEFAESITVKTDNVAVGEYVLVDNYAAGFEGFTFNLNGTACQLGYTITENDVDTTLFVNDAGQLVLAKIAREDVGAVADITSDVKYANKNIAANANGTSLTVKRGSESDIELTNVTLEGKVLVGENSDITVKTSGNTTINGAFKTSAGSSQVNLETSGNTIITGNSENGYAKIDIKVAENSTTVMGNIKGTLDIAVGDAAALKTGSVEFANTSNNVTIGERATLNAGGAVDLGQLDDEFTVGDNAVLTIAGNLSLGNGNDTLTIGKGAKVTVDGTVAGGGNSENNTLVMQKGSSLTSQRHYGIQQYTVDVDAILTDTTKDTTSVKIDITGVNALTDVAGAKVIFAGGYSVSSVKFDGVDAVLNVSGTNYYTDATHLAGADGEMNTADDVWASLNKVDNNLVVAWGRSEEEVGAALNAFNEFKACQDYVVGDAMVSTDLGDGFDKDTDTLNKKSNGQLA